MTPTITVPNFEGPLGLLLELVEQGELEVTAISVAAVTRQYLDRVATLTELSRADLAQFLELGTRLVFIKSAALLPVAETDVTTPAAELRQLNRELAEYRQFQLATQQLRARLNQGRRSYERHGTQALQLGDLPTPELNLLQLGQLFAAALERTAPAPATVITREHYDQAKIGQSLWQRTAQGEVALSEVIDQCHDRVEIIVTFLAVLELVRDGRVAVRQSAAFDELRLVRL